MMRVKKYNVSIPLGIILFACLLFRDNTATCYISATALLLHVIFNLLCGDLFYIKYLWWFIASAFLVIGAFACEVASLWLAEIASLTHYNGSFNVIAFYYYVFFTILRLVDPYFNRKTKFNRTIIKWNYGSLTSAMVKYGGFLVFSIGAVLFLSVATHPFFQYGVENRFEYAQTFISRWQNILRTFPPLLAPLTIIPFVSNYKINFHNIVRHVVIPYMPFLLFLIWTGNKYGAYIELLCIIMVPFLFLHKTNVRSGLQYGSIMFIVIVGLLLLYYHLKGLSLYESLYQIALRIAVQAELWWKTISNVNIHGSSFSEFGKEMTYQFDAIISEGASKQYGVYHLMTLLADQSIAGRYSLIGTRYSATGMELAFYCFGFGGFLLPIIVCPIIAWVNNLYINSIMERRPLCALVTARIIMLILPAMAQGDFYSFFSTVQLMFVILFIAIGFWNATHARRKRVKSLEQLIKSYG